MKIKLLKDHVLGKAGDVIEETVEKANYLVRCNVAEVVSGDKPAPKHKAKSKKK